MDSIHLSSSSGVLYGLEDMLRHVEGFESHSLVHGYIPVETALFVVRIAKLSPDNPGWFIRGKWATIQAIESRIDDYFEGIKWLND